MQRSATDASVNLKKKGHAEHATVVHTTVEHLQFFRVIIKTRFTLANTQKHAYVHGKAKPFPTVHLPALRRILGIWTHNFCYLLLPSRLVFRTIIGTDLEYM